jgi:hypothetical protein
VRPLALVAVHLRVWEGVQHLAFEEVHPVARSALVAARPEADAAGTLHLAVVWSETRHHGRRTI